MVFPPVLRSESARFTGRQEQDGGQQCLVEWRTGDHVVTRANMGRKIKHFIKSSRCAAGNLMIPDITMMTSFVNTSAF